MPTNRDSLKDMLNNKVFMNFGKYTMVKAGDEARKLIFCLAIIIYKGKRMHFRCPPFCSLTGVRCCLCLAPLNSLVSCCLLSSASTEHNSTECIGQVDVCMLWVLFTRWCLGAVFLWSATPLNGVSRYQLIAVPLVWTSCYSMHSANKPALTS